MLLLLLPLPGASPPPGERTSKGTALRRRETQEGAIERSSELVLDLGRLCQRVRWPAGGLAWTPWAYSGSSGLLGAMSGSVRQGFLG